MKITTCLFCFQREKERAERERIEKERKEAEAEKKAAEEAERKKAALAALNANFGGNRTGKRKKLKKVFIYLIYNI